jgi:hypothetical protein
LIDIFGEYGARQKTDLTPNPKGTYIVAGIRHYGDTRGTPWYSEITGVTQAGLLAVLSRPQ